VKEQADHISLRLLIEGSVLVLVLGAWLWGLSTLGAHTMVTQQPPTSAGGNLPGYVASCSGVQSPEEGVRSVGSGDGSGCLLQEVRSGMSTSRQPGAGLTEQVHRGDR
jgi:hypothetical protein